MLKNRADTSVYEKAILTTVVKETGLEMFRTQSTRPRPVLDYPLKEEAQYARHHQQIPTHR